MKDQHSIEIKVEWDAAHRLLNYDGPCKDNHGHRYFALISFTAEELNDTGFVIDFTEVKRNIKHWIDEYWDHGTILNSHDTEFIRFLNDQKNKVYIISGNPTAEIIAKALFYQIKSSGYGNIDKVTVYETPTSSATFSRRID